MRRPQHQRQLADRRRFAESVIGRLHRLGITELIEYDGDRFALRLKVAGGTQRTLPLSQWQFAFQMTPPHLRELLLDRYLEAQIRALQVPDRITPEEGRRRLLPRVRARIDYDLLDPSRVEASERPSMIGRPYRLLAEHLAVGLVCDYPRVAIDVNEDMLADWGLSADEAFLLAEGNLRARKGLPFQSPQPGVFLSAGQDGHAAAHLLLTDVVRQHAVRGAYVACVPRPGLLAVSGIEELVGLPALLDAAEAAFEGETPNDGLPTLVGDEPISGLPVCWHEGCWRPLQLPPGHPESRRLRWLRIRSLAADYSTQGRALDPTGWCLHEYHFVPDYFPVRDCRSGEPESYCIWTKGMPALLPRTTLVFFYRRGSSGKFEPVARGTWERVRQVVGQLLQPLGVYPERFRVDDFPTDEQLAAIGPPNSNKYLVCAPGWQSEWPAFAGAFVGLIGP